MAAVSALYKKSVFSSAAIWLSLICILNLAAASPCKEIESYVVDNLSAEMGFPVYTWAPETSPKAIILSIHGATLHGRSFTALAEHLTKAGYAVFSPDLRGFGAWYHDSNPADKSARHVLYKQSEADLKTLLIKMHQLYPGKPLFLIGESVGANFAVKLLADDPKCADGMILSSPAVKQRIFLGPTVILQALTVFFWNPAAQLDVTPFLRSRVSESEEITEERVNDPLGRNKMNVGELVKTRWFNKECLKSLANLPGNKSVLVLEGSEDKFFHASDIDNFMQEMPCEDKTLHMLKGRGHINLETAYIAPEVKDMVDSWLADKTNKFAQSKSKGTAVSSREPQVSTP